MFKRKKDIILVLIILLLFILIAYPMNSWLSDTMPRHQIIQLPATFGLGFILGIHFSRVNTKETYRGIAMLIFIMASFVFWMLPHSIDYAVINPSFNRIMLLNMLIAGILLMPVMRNIIFEIKILFLGMLSAMLLATGMTLKSFTILLCSSFTIIQQKETGSYLIMAGFFLFSLTLIFFFKAPGEKKNDNPNGARL